MFAFQKYISVRKQHDLFLLTGANMGQRYQNLTVAAQKLTTQLGELVASSAIYETAAWGSGSALAYLNQALWLRTSAEPLEVLAIALQIEKEAGRERTGLWADRTLDIDILLYDQRVLTEAQLQIPHPQLQNRSFALVPLAEIAGDYNHPVFEKTITALRNSCPDTLAVKRWEDNL